MQTIHVRTDYTIDVPDYGSHLDIDQLIDLVKRSGSHFFDKDSMRFFRSRVDYYTFAGPDGWYFVTSEKHVSAFANINEPRMWTVRRLSVTDDGLRLYELEGFQAYSSLTRARTAAKRSAQEGRSICQSCRLRLYIGGSQCAECQERAERIAAKAV